jgi:hypothetical protein
MKTSENSLTGATAVALHAVVRRDWSKEFNALPEDVRTIGCAMEARTRIQQLEMEKDRLKKRYRQSVGEIDAHIENCRVWLHKLEAPNASS